MNLLVLSQQFRGVLALLELWHFLRENGEDVLFFDRVVRGEVRAELQAGGEELLEGEIAGAFVGLAGCVEKCPGLAEVVVLVVVSCVLQSSCSLSW